MTQCVTGSLVDLVWVSAMPGPLRSTLLQYREDLLPTDLLEFCARKILRASRPPNDDTSAATSTISSSARDGNSEWLKYSRSTLPHPPPNSEKMDTSTSSTLVYEAPVASSVLLLCFSTWYEKYGRHAASIAITAPWLGEFIASLLVWPSPRYLLSKTQCPEDDGTRLMLAIMRRLCPKHVETIAQFGYIDEALVRRTYYPVQTPDMADSSCSSDGGQDEEGGATHHPDIRTVRRQMSSEEHEGRTVPYLPGPPTAWTEDILSPGQCVTWWPAICNTLRLVRTVILLDGVPTLNSRTLFSCLLELTSACARQLLVLYTNDCVPTHANNYDDDDDDSNSHHKTDSATTTGTITASTSSTLPVSPRLKILHQRRLLFARLVDDMVTVRDWLAEQTISQRVMRRMYRHIRDQVHVLKLIRKARHAPTVVKIAHWIKSRHRHHPHL